MNSRFTNLRQACLGSTCLSVAFGAVVALSAPAMADPMPTTSPFLSGVATAINNTTLKSFLDSDNPFTLYGVTLYGTADASLNNSTHGTTYNPDFPTSVGEMVQKNGSNDKSYLVSSGMEQSKIGLRGSEEMFSGVNFVFKLESAFNPVSGNIPNSQRAQMRNAGLMSYPYVGSSTNGDSSRAGQLFQGGAFGGVSNATFGTLTFGRHNAPLLDLIGAYDPMENAYAFSPIGWSGMVAGGGDTEDARLDKSLKYNVKYGPVRLAAIYQMPNTTNSNGGDDAEQINLGVDYGALSMDAIYAIKHDAINIGSAPSAATTTTLTPTVSDNYTYAVMAKYNLNPVKIMGAYEHITYLNPATPLTQVQGDTIGGFAYGTPANTSYTTAKIFHVLWTGAQYQITDALKLEVAYYLYLQDNFSGLDNSACVTANKSSCQGREHFVSGALDYRLNKRIDVYGGLFYTRVEDGMYVGNSYLHSNNLSSTTGLRFKF